jgi:hypothetical protein
MAAKKRNIIDDMKELALESEFLELPTPKVAPKKVAPKVASKKAAPKKVIVVAKKAAVLTPLVGRGAVVKKDPKRGPAGRQPPYKPTAKITVIEGVRNYRVPGKVHDAVQLMRKHGTVEAYEKAMEKSENDLPAIGLLRYLHKKQAVKVD